jgi:hypothetical protein
MIDYYLMLTFLNACKTGIALLIRSSQFISSREIISRFTRIFMYDAHQATAFKPNMLAC